MLAAIEGGHRSGGVLIDLGAGFEPSALGGLGGLKRVAVDIKPGRGLDLVADGNRLPVRDRAAAVVLLMETLEHVPTPLRLLQECARILEAGGHLCVTVPQYCMVHDHPGDFYRFTHEGLRYLCREAGLRIVDIHATGGPFLVIFHAIERNLPPRPRMAFVALTYRAFDWLDGRLCGHGNRAGVQDAIGWGAVLAVKP